MITLQFATVATLITFSTSVLAQTVPPAPTAPPAPPAAPTAAPASTAPPAPTPAPAPIDPAAQPMPAQPPAPAATAMPAPYPYPPPPPIAPQTVICPAGTAPFLDPQLGTAKCLAMEEETRPRVGLIVGGSITFGIGYSIAFAIAAGGDYNDVTGYMAVPIFGPFITMAQHDYGDCSGSIDCSGTRAADTLATVGLVFNFLMQAGGATMLIVGIAVPKKTKVPRVAVGPMAVGSGAGLGATLSF